MDFLNFDVIEKFFSKTISIIYGYFYSIAISLWGGRRGSVNTYRKYLDNSESVSGPYTTLFFSFFIPSFPIIFGWEYVGDAEKAMVSLYGEHYIALIVSIFFPVVFFDFLSRVFIKSLSKEAESIWKYNSPNMRQNFYYFVSPYIFISLLAYEALSSGDTSTFRYGQYTVLYYSSFCGVMFLCILMIRSLVKMIVVTSRRRKASIFETIPVVQIRLDHAGALITIFIGCVTGVAAWSGSHAYFIVWRFFAKNEIEISELSCRYQDHRLDVSAFLKNRSSAQIFVINKNIKISALDVNENIDIENMRSNDQNIAPDKFVISVPDFLGDISLKGNEVTYVRAYVDLDEARLSKFRLGHPVGCGLWIGGPVGWVKKELRGIG